MLKQGLQLKQTTRLSSMQIQTIKMLELTSVELDQRIKKEIEDNPVLEEVIEDGKDEDGTQKQISLSEYGADDPTPSYKYYVNNRQGKEDTSLFPTFSVKESFQQSLEAQLGYTELDERERKIAQFVIGMLDDDGYLRRDLESLSDDIAFRLNIETSEEELEKILSVIQEFEPVGVGARDLRECLLLQLEARTQTEPVALAVTILTDYFAEFTKKHYEKIISRLNVTEDELRGAIEEIVKLNPRPGGQIDDSYTEQAQQVTPDFILELHDGELEMTMPKFSVPELKINKRYAELLVSSVNTKTKEGKEAAMFVKQKLDSAKWFIEAIKQRHNTLHSTMQAIIDFQYEFFLEGDETKLKPMVLKNIAEKTGYDISTISRVVNCKYIQTHFGMYPLKYFFSEGLKNSSGEEVSTREIKKILSDSIDAEDKRKPLTDEELVEQLSQKGYKVARRTVAKYREQLNIPIARLRKVL